MLGDNKSIMVVGADIIQIEMYDGTMRTLEA